MSITWDEEGFDHEAAAQDHDERRRKVLDRMSMSETGDPWGSDSDDEENEQ
jgi:hypothetical protein